MNILGISISEDFLKDSLLVRAVFRDYLEAHCQVVRLIVIGLCLAVKPAFSL